MNSILTLISSRMSFPSNQVGWLRFNEKLSVQVQGCSKADIGTCIFAIVHGEADETRIDTIARAEFVTQADWRVISDEQEEARDYLGGCEERHDTSQ
jgi:hypothetical protein